MKTLQDCFPTSLAGNSGIMKTLQAAREVDLAHNNQQDHEDAAGCWGGCGQQLKHGDAAGCSRDSVVTQ